MNEKWQQFLATCTEEDAHKAIKNQFEFAKGLEENGIDAIRLLEMHKKACDIYRDRFSKDWRP